MAVAPLQRSKGGSSGSFLVLASDEKRYWCKTLNNLQESPRVPVNEQIVARLGALIGAPVCPVELVRIPRDLVGWEIREGTGRHLEEGWAHGSLAVEPAVETRTLTNRSSDDNGRRHAGIYALYDWLGGSDPQWLMVGSDAAYYSHDHGHYFPGGPQWTIESLNGHSGAVFHLGVSGDGLDASEVRRLAERLEATTEQEIAACLSNIPADWPVRDDELEALAEFIHGRRQPVAQRLRALVGRV